LLVDWNREQDAWVVTDGAEPPEDWLATTIRGALRSSVGNAEPSPAIWDRIRQNTADMDLSLSRQEENSVMVNPNDILLQRERYKDLLREAEQKRLLQAAGLRRPGNWRPHRKVANWIGIQMVRWGRKLQRYGTTPAPCYPSCQ
jgi:hypothetical protein